MIWMESPSNPLLKLADLEAVGAIAKRHHLPVGYHNTFASPYCQRPLTLGFDIVVYSVTKYINGHSDMIGGIAVVGDNVELAQELKFLQNAVGGVSGPFDSFLAFGGSRPRPAHAAALPERERIAIARRPARRAAAYLSRAEKPSPICHCRSGRCMGMEAWCPRYWMEASSGRCGSLNGAGFLRWPKAWVASRVSSSTPRLLPMPPSLQEDEPSESTMGWCVCRSEWRMRMI